MTQVADPKAAQRIQALAIGNKIRYDRAAFKTELKVMKKNDAILKVIELLEDNPRFVHSLKIGDLLNYVPRLNYKTKARALRAASCSENRTVERLTSRQRFELIIELDAIASK